MNERFQSTARNLFALGAAAGTLMLGIGDASAGRFEELSSLDNNPKVLSVGESIFTARVLSPALTKDTSTTIMPNSAKDVEDLAVIYDKKSSDTLINAMGEPELGDSVGFIIESNLGETAMKIVYFKTQTGKISLVSPAVGIDPSHRVFRYVDRLHPERSYTTIVQPQAKLRKAVTIKFKHDHATGQKA